MRQAFHDFGNYNRRIDSQIRNSQLCVQALIAYNNGLLTISTISYYQDGHSHFTGCDISQVYDNT